VSYVLVMCRLGLRARVLRASIPRASAYREPERAPRETVARGVKSRPKKVEHTPL